MNTPDIITYSKVEKNIFMRPDEGVNYYDAVCSCVNPIYEYMLLFNPRGRWRVGIFFLKTRQERVSGHSGNTLNGKTRIMLLRSDAKRSEGKRCDAMRCYPRLGKARPGDEE